MQREEKKSLIPDSHYEERRITPRWRQDAPPSAGIFLLDGRFHVAAYGSVAEQRVREDGGLLVASLVFDGSHAERPVRGAPVIEPLPSPLTAFGQQRAAETLGWAPTGN